MKALNGLMIWAIIIFWVGGGYAAIRVADNNPKAPTGDNVYPTLQDALNAAEKGDIIHVIPSLQGYGNATIPEGLSVTIYGIGNPEKDMAYQSFANNITLGGGSSGTKIAGLGVNVINCTSSIQVHDITIEKCYIGGISTPYKGNIDSLVIRNCVITGDIDLEYVQNALVSNNFIAGRMTRATNYTLITNNIFYDSNRSSNFGGELHDCIVANNIFYRRSPANPNHQRSIFNNNISFETDNPELPPVGNGTNSGIGNLTDVALEVIQPPATGQSIYSSNFQNYDFHLKDNSPGKKAGSDGTDIGLFGGAVPFVENFSSLPVIIQLNTSGVIREGSDLDVSVKAKAN